MLKTHSLIEPQDLSVKEIEELFVLADDIKNRPELYVNACAGKLMGTLFYEPSTRTRLSFASAMNRLGGPRGGLLRPRLLQRDQGRNRGRHRPDAQCLRRHHRHAAPLRGRSQGGQPVQRHPGDQRR